MKIAMKQRRRRDDGQVIIFVVLALGIFLLAAVGFATDYTNFWMHRQQAQSGADATCQAAATDLLLIAQDVDIPNRNFTPTINGTVDCSTSPTAAPCVIARYNGFDAAIASNQVVMSFPATVSGAPPPPAEVAVPYVQVDVTQQVSTYFSRLLSGNNQVAVHAKAVCGIVSTPGPVPIVVLHPTDPATINMNGATNAITVVGGPNQSIQVNSTNQSAVTSGSLATINLSQGGPDYTGSDFGTFGGQATQPGGVNLGSTGHWRYPHLPIVDPYAAVPAPSQPATMGTSVHKNFTEDGCPDTSGCTEYRPGYYPSGIKVMNETAIFVPGLYYIGGSGANNGFKLASNSIVRTAVGPSMVGDDGSGGVMFYFSGNGSTSVDINANSGKPHGSFNICTSAPPTKCIVKYHVDGSSEFGVASRALQCPGGAANPSGLPATIDGNVLLAPCSGTYGDPANKYRGFLYFQDRAVAVDGSTGNGVPSWQGGGSTLAAGFMYFHQCRSGDHTGTGRCAAFGDVFHMGGTPGSGSYAVGSLITDKIYTNGTPNITMILYPDSTFPGLKVVFFE